MLINFIISIKSYDMEDIFISETDHRSFIIKAKCYEIYILSDFNWNTDF